LEGGTVPEIDKRRALGSIRKCGMDCHYVAGAMAVCLEYLWPAEGRAGPPPDYAFITGVSGSAFSATWQDLRQEQADIVQYAGVWEEPARRAFAACGCACEIRTAPAGTGEAAELYKAEALRAIGQGRPLLAHGVMGPPVVNVVAGYDEGGDTLIGTGFFHNFAAQLGCFPCPPDREFPHLWALDREVWNLEDPVTIAFGERLATPEPAQAYKDALGWAVTVQSMERLPGRPEVHCGNAALRKAASDLLDENFFPPGEQKAVADAHNAWDGLMTTLFGRCFAGLFLRRAGEHWPAAAAALEKAAVCCDQIMGGPDSLAPRLNAEQTGASFADPETRRNHAAMLRQAADLDNQAMDLIREAPAVL
jgi:hypothetical protein